MNGMCLTKKESIKSGTIGIALGYRVLKRLLQNVWESETRTLDDQTYQLALVTMKRGTEFLKQIEECCNIQPTYDELKKKIHDMDDEQGRACLLFLCVLITASCVTLGMPVPYSTELSMPVEYEEPCFTGDVNPYNFIFDDWEVAKVYFATLISSSYVLENREAKVSRVAAFDMQGTIASYRYWLDSQPHQVNWDWDAWCYIEKNLTEAEKMKCFDCHREKGLTT